MYIYILFLLLQSAAVDTGLIQMLLGGTALLMLLLLLPAMAMSMAMSMEMTMMTTTMTMSQ